MVIVANMKKYGNLPDLPESASPPSLYFGGRHRATPLRSTVPRLALMAAATSPPPFVTAWHHWPIDEPTREGELEWPTVNEEAGKKKDTSEQEPKQEPGEEAEETAGASTGGGGASLPLRLRACAGRSHGESERAECRVGERGFSSSLSFWSLYSSVFRRRFE